MTVSGDLSTIDLADLLQNIESHSRTGTLSLRSEAGDASLFFRDGRVAMLQRPNRPSLVDMLVATGQVTAKKVEAARKKQKGSRRCVAEWLVGARSLTAEALREFAEQQLDEDVADLIADAKGEFEFAEGDTPVGEFDPDEASLQLSRAVAPLVLEATRRVDHWVEIRKFVPSDAMHFRVRPGQKAPADCEDAETAASLLQLLDGSRSALELVAMFPDRRFLAWKLLAELVRDHVARPASGDDLLALVKAAEHDDPQRARLLAQRALDSEPHHLQLLAAEAALAEQLGDKNAATAAHKLLAHLHLEAGRADEALTALTEGKRLSPADPSLWERSLQLALTQGRRQDALREGLRLVELHRGPGLHARAKAVLDRLLSVEPNAIELHVEFARSCVDCGTSDEAVKHLARQGKVLVGAENYVGARTLYGEILAIDPNHREAAVSIEMIDKEEFARRRARRRRWAMVASTACAGLMLGTLACLDVVARVACIEARSLIARERMVEHGHHRDALAVWERLRAEHPFSLVRWLEVPREIADLQDRIAEGVAEREPGELRQR